MNANMWSDVLRATLPLTLRFQAGEEDTQRYPRCIGKGLSTTRISIRQLFRCSKGGSRRSSSQLLTQSSQPRLPLCGDRTHLQRAYLLRLVSISAPRFQALFWYYSSSFHLYNGWFSSPRRDWFSRRPLSQGPPVQLRMSGVLSPPMIHAP